MNRGIKFGVVVLFLVFGAVLSAQEHKPEPKRWPASLAEKQTLARLMQAAREINAQVDQVVGEAKILRGIPQTTKVDFDGEAFVETGTASALK